MKRWRTKEYMGRGELRNAVPRWYPSGRMMYQRINYGATTDGWITYDSSKNDFCWEKQTQAPTTVQLGEGKVEQ
jgi:hypothetical protein